MDLIAHLRSHFEEGIELRRRMAETLPPHIVNAGQAMAQAIRSGHKILSCGNGGSAADSQHFAAEMVGRFERERPGMPAVSLTVDTSALTAIANDYDYDHVFSKQVEALGQAGDMLLGISTSGNSRNVVEAMKAAQAKGMAVGGRARRGRGGMARMLRPQDFHLNVAHPRTMRVQEVHLLCIHSLCEVIDNVIHGERK
jgi:D-sedoheptulose 7-phosphate isomerase